MDAAKLFDNWAKGGRAEGMEQGHLQTAGPVLFQLNIEPMGTFLDLGCGNGWASEWAARAGANVIAIDASQEMVERAQKRIPTARVHRGDFATLPVEDNTVQIVWSMEAIYYAQGPDEVLKEIARVLAPGGQVHILIDYYEENQASHSWPESVGVAMTLRSESEWQRALEKVGLITTTSRLRGVGELWKQEQGTLYLHGISPKLS